jgi:hypothetical protein
VPGYYNPYEGKSKRKPAHMIEVLETNAAPCLTSTKTESVKGSHLSFVLDNAAEVSVCGNREAFATLTEDNETVMKWVESSTTLKSKCKGLINVVMTDAVTTRKVPITIEALFVDGATNIPSQRELYLKHGYKSQTSDDQETITLTNSVMKHTWRFDIVDGLYRSLMEIPQPREVMAVMQIASTTGQQSSSSLKLWHL